MKIVIINGSARKGNILTAINAFMKGAADRNAIEVIQPDKLHISPCKGCGVCQCHKGCVDNDDTNPTIDKIAAADMILFATPVYWWGMSAQLKQVIDKCYCRGMQLKGKKAGVIVAGGSPVDNIQYELIRKQFECMAGYLSWDMLFQKSYYATDRDELAKNTAAIEELEVSFMSQEDFSDIYAFEKEMFKEAECIMVTVNIKNMSEEKQRVTLEGFTLTSQAWTTCTAPDKYMAVNEKWNSEQYQSGSIYIESGEERKLILPFLLVKNGFRQKQWEHVKERNYELVLSLYPVKKQIKLKCV